MSPLSDLSLDAAVSLLTVRTLAGQVKQADGWKDTLSNAWKHLSTGGAEAGDPLASAAWESARNGLIGAGVGGVGGALHGAFGDDDEKDVPGGAMRGALLGGAVGAGGTAAYRGLQNAMAKPQSTADAEAAVAAAEAAKQRDAAGAAQIAGEVGNTAAHGPRGMTTVSPPASPQSQMANAQAATEQKFNQGDYKGTFKDFLKKPVQTSMIPIGKGLNAVQELMHEDNPPPPPGPGEPKPTTGYGAGIGALAGGGGMAGHLYTTRMDKGLRGMAAQHANDLNRMVPTPAGTPDTATRMTNTPVYRSPSQHATAAQRATIRQHTGYKPRGGGAGMTLAGAGLGAFLGNESERYLNNHPIPEGKAPPEWQKPWEWLSTPTPTAPPPVRSQWRHGPPAILPIKPRPAAPARFDAPNELLAQ